MTNNIANCENGISISTPAKAESDGEKMNKSKAVPTVLPPSPPSSLTVDSLFYSEEKPPYNSTVAAVTDGAQYTPSPSKPPMDAESSQSSESPLTLRQMCHMVSVVISSSIINGVVFGVVNNFGLFYYYLVELFKTDDSILHWTSQDDEPDVASNSTTSDALRQSLIGRLN